MKGIFKLREDWKVFKLEIGWEEGVRRKGDVEVKGNMRKNWWGINF